jgi:hypothetical protein
MFIALVQSDCLSLPKIQKSASREMSGGKTFPGRRLIFTEESLARSGAARFNTGDERIRAGGALGEIIGWTI